LNLDAETSTLTPTHGGGFDVTAFAHQQGGNIDLHMSEGCALALQRSQTQAIAFGSREVAGTLTSNYGKQPDSSDSALGPNLAVQSSAVRRLTPIECERLQGFPDNFTAVPWRGKPADQCPDGPRYKALGNSMAVPVMAWIGQRIQQVEGVLQARKEAA
jgi:DNA (cytosine-5)-methyltransferase 1